jgi:predicted SAM-dependent methyltransferase
MIILSLIYQMLAKIARLFGFNISLIKVGSDLGLYNDYSQESKKQRRFYNIGAGLFQHPFWTNIDYASEHYSQSQKYPFINYNLMELKPLPIENNVAEIVYSSHVIEHISDEAALNMLKESHRILKAGGCIRLTTPDMQLQYQAYQRNDIRFWYWVAEYIKKGSWEKIYKIPLSKATIHQLFLHHFASQLSTIDVDDSAPKKYTDADIIKVFANLSMEEAFDYFSKQCKYNPKHPGNHVNWWTYDKLFAYLRKAGFTKYYRSGYGQSLFTPLRDTNYFDTTHPRMSLFVEAVK